MADIHLQKLPNAAALEFLLASTFTQMPADSAESMALFGMIDASQPAIMENLLDELLPYRINQSAPINLYDDLVKPEIVAIGVRLVSLQINPQAIAAACRAAFNSSGLSLLASTSQAALDKHLRELREVHLPDGSSVLFRYQDTRVTTALMPLLTPQQAICLLGAANAWFVPHVCGQAYGWQYAQETTNTKSAPLTLTPAQLAALDDELFVNTVEKQANETDMSLLAGNTPCAIAILLKQRIQQALDIGLKHKPDLSLLAVLSLQMPQGFAKKPPFAQAIEDAVKQKSTLAEALDKITPSQWQAFERH